MKIHWTALTREGQRHLLMLVLVFSSGLGLVAWCWPLGREALQTLREEVGRLQAERSAPQRKSPRVAGGADARSPDAPVPDEPALAEADAVWPWLQARMQAQGLQVQALRPQAVTTKDGLPQQAVTLQLQGRWQDWLALQAALSAHAPWWVIDQWQVSPVPSGSEAVRIELQARLGLRPPALPGPGMPRDWSRDWPRGPVAAALPATRSALFASAAGAVPATSGPEAAGALPAHPHEWPLDRLRLLGVWRQAGVPHAVIGAGQGTVVLGVGQRIGREAYRVHRIGDDHVELLATDPRGPALRLVLQEGKP